jgi:hypothetical protein
VRLRRKGVLAAAIVFAACLALSLGCSKKVPSEGSAPSASGSAAGKGDPNLPPLDPETFPHAEK